MNQQLYCENCGEELPQETWRSDEDGDIIAKKSPKFAALLNFSMPGYGYIYLREKKKGILFWIIFVALAASVYGLLLAIPLWMFGIYSAHSKAKSNFRQ